MLDDFSRPDRTRIDVNEDREVRFWCDHYEVSEAALRKAVADVGVSAEHVGEHLGMPLAMRGRADRAPGAGQREARA
jgi:hypothetical protein